MRTINIRHDYTIDVPEYGAHLDIDDLQRIVTRSGSHFFDRDTMKWFRSRVDWHTYAGPDGWYFVTSEKHESAYMRINQPRLYTVRCLRLENYDGTPGIELYELYGFQAFKSLDSARRAAKRAATGGTDVCSICHLRLIPKDHPQRACSECDERESRRQLAAAKA